MLRCETAKTYVGIAAAAALLSFFLGGSAAAGPVVSAVDLRDQEALFGYVSREIVDVSRDQFDTWQIHHLDVTRNGWAEAVLIGSTAEQGYPEMQIIEIAEGGFGRVPAEIPLGSLENVPEIMVGGSLAVTSTSSENKTLTTVVNQYVYIDGMHLVFSGSPEEHAEYVQGLLWEMEHSCAGENIDGRNVHGFAKEIIAGTPTAYDAYVGVVVPMYDGVNRDNLDAVHFTKLGVKPLPLGMGI